MRNNNKTTNLSSHSIGLVDITTIAIDTNLPQKERHAEYIRQIRNPHKYICGKFTVTAVHPNNGVTLEDCLRGMMA